MRGRVLVLVWIALVTMSFGAPAAAAPDPAVANGASMLAGAFDDVPDGHVFDIEIAWLASTGITQGREGGTFGSSDAVTRGQMAAFLYRYDDEPDGPFDAPPFQDVPDGHVFATEIAWLASTGITEGREGGTFGSDDAVTRGQMAAFLYRFQAWESRDEGPVSVHFVDWDNRTYDDLCDEGPGTVHDGAWRDADRYHRDGDVRFDGTLAWELGSINGHDAAVALVTFPCVVGSSTAFYNAQVFSVAAGEVVAVGDRLHGSGPTLEQGGVRMTNNIWPEDDPRCCPSEQEEVLARLIDGQWVEEPV